MGGGETTREHRKVEAGGGGGAGWFVLRGLTEPSVCGARRRLMHNAQRLEARPLAACR